jgi:hypothetical protein
MQTSPTYWLTRFWFQRSLALIYFIGFLIVANQFRALCGENGILPARLFLQRVGFWDSPSLFFIDHSDRAFFIGACLGIVLAVIALSGLSDAFGQITSMIVWSALWILYLSFVNVGQTFYGFGWETLLLETGFLAIFLGPSRVAPPVIVIWLLRWVLFRMMFGAGLIKIRGDECWRDLTCMNYHYETQPMPGPLSYYFHLLPEWINKGSVLFNHFVELVVPFFIFGTRRFRHWAGLITIVFQILLILSGNLSWLNYLTIVLCISCFDDSVLPRAFAWIGDTPDAATWSAALVGGIPSPLIYGLTALILALSIRPAMNLFSKNQMMNSSFDSFHLVNTYGAFGSITRTRYEVIVEGTDDEAVSATTQWKEYGFKGKPGFVDKMPPLISPYHLHLDWQMWFAAMSSYEDHPWIVNFLAKLLDGNKDVAGLLEVDPFQASPPKYVRAMLYEYHFSKEKGRWWDREKIGVYLPPLSLKDPAFHEVLVEQGWIRED